MHLAKRNPISYHSSKNGNSSSINNQSNNNLILILTVSFYQANTQYAFTMSCSIKSYLRHYKTSWFLVTTKAGRQEDEEREAQQHYSDCPSTKQQGCQSPNTLVFYSLADVSITHLPTLNTIAFMMHIKLFTWYNSL